MRSVARGDDWHRQELSFNGGCAQRAGTSLVNMRRSWKGRSIFSRATEDGPAFCECCVCTDKYTVPALLVCATCTCSTAVKDDVIAPSFSAAYL